MAPTAQARTHPAHPHEVRPSQPAQTQPAPGDLELVRGLVNTEHLELGTDVLAGPADLSRWLTDHDLPAGRVSATDLGRVRQLRDTLRAMLVANHDRADLDGETVAALDDLVSWAGLRIRFTPERSWRTSAAGSGVRAAVGGLLGVVVEAMADGSWERLKACGNEACRWGFYDTSRARTAKWCSMQICGNRMKQQAWRERTRGTG